jgi:hypothetical protein
MRAWVANLLRPVVGEDSHLSMLALFYAHTQHCAAVVLFVYSYTYSCMITGPLQTGHGRLQCILFHVCYAVQNTYPTHLPALQAASVATQFAVTWLNTSSSAGSNPENQGRAMAGRWKLDADPVMSTLVMKGQEIITGVVAAVVKARAGHKPGLWSTLVVMATSEVRM